MRAFCRATRTPACKEYDALKAKLGRGNGPTSSVPVSGELFVTKKFGQMKRLFFFGDFLLSQQKESYPPAGAGPGSSPRKASIHRQHPAPLLRLIDVPLQRPQALVP